MKFKTSGDLDITLNFRDDLDPHKLGKGIALILSQTDDPEGNLAKFNSFIEGAKAEIERQRSQQADPVDRAFEE